MQEHVYPLSGVRNTHTQTIPPLQGAPFNFLLPSNHLHFSFSRSPNYPPSIFTALHGMQTRSSDENSVRPSVRLSVTRVHCDKTEERTVQIFTPYER